MNNSKLLTGLLAAILLSGGVCAQDSLRSVITLEELFEIAETNSAQLRPSFTAEQEAAKEISEARNNLLPDINAVVSASYIGDGFTLSRSFSDYQRAPIPHLGNGLSLSVSQPVYTGGAVKSAIEVASLKSTASRYAADLQRDNIRLRLTGFYLDIYKFESLRAVVQRNIAQARRVLEQMHARFEQGTALQNDITRYELLVSNLELQIVKIDGMLDILNRNIAVTAGLPETTTIRPDSTILRRTLPRESREWWERQAGENSPSLMLAGTTVDISRKAERIVRSERLPKIAVQAGWSLEGPILVEVPPINRNLSYWYVGVGVCYNISSLYKTGKSVSRSRLSTRRATEEYDAMREQVQLAVGDQHVHYLEAFEELKTCRKSVELAERNYNTVSARYNTGMALLSDMLDAADTKLDAERRLVEARIDVIYHYYKLLFISGKI